jgi:hypothetical protein
MPRHLSAIAFAWVATLAAAYIAGRVAGPLLPTEEKTPPPPQELRSSQAAPVVARSSQPEPKDASQPQASAESATEHRRPAAAPSVAVPLDVVLRKALDEPDAVEKLIGIAEVLRKVDASTIESLVAEFDSQTDGEDWSIMQHRQLLYYKWGMIDGEAALAYLDNSDTHKHHKRYLQSSILAGWASKDADSAIVWAQDNHEGDENPYMSGIISGLANTDLTRAGDLLQTLPYGTTRGRAAYEVVRAHMREGQETAKEWAAGLPADQLKDGVVSMVARELAKDSPQRAAEWLNSMEDVNPEKSVSSIARQWAREKPQEAADWVASFEDEATRRASLPNVISTWAAQDMHAAGEWLRQYPATPERDAAIASYAYRLARTDAESAEAWANSIVEEQQRERVLRSVKQMAKHHHNHQVQ